MPKKPKTITIPFDLARLLTAERDDFKDPSKFAESQTIAKAMLKLLMVTAD